MHNKVSRILICLFLFVSHESFCQKHFLHLSEGEVYLLNKYSSIEELSEEKYNLEGIRITGVRKKRRKKDNSESGKIEVVFEVTNLDIEKRLMISEWGINDVDIVLKLDSCKLNGGLRIENSNLHELSVTNSEIEAEDNGFVAFNSYIDKFIVAYNKIKTCTYISSNDGEDFAYYHNSSKGLLFYNNTFKETTFNLNSIGGSKTSFVMSDNDNFPYYIGKSDFTSELVEFRGNDYFTYPFNTKIEKCTFAGETKFYGEGKDSGAKEPCIFDGIEFKGQVHFEGKIPERLGFINTSNSSVIDFTRIDASSKCSIDIKSLDIKKLELNYSNFQLVNIFYTNRENEEFYTDYDNVKNEAGKLEAVFIKLLSKYKDSDFNNNFKLIDLDYKRYKYGTLGRSNFWQGVYYFTSKLWWNFGHSKQRIIGWTIALFFIFFLINLVHISFILNDVVNYPKLESLLTEGENNFWLKLNVTFYFTAIIFFGLKININQIKFAFLIWTLYIYFMYVVGLICIAFLFNLIVSI